MEIRFHLDENVHLAVAAGLRHRGCDVSTPVEAGLIGASDERHLAFARKEGRVVITHDMDFLRLHSAGGDHNGIVFCHAGSRSLKEIIRALTRLALRQTAETMMNRVEFL